MTGVEKQVGQLAAADGGQVAGRGWPQAGPALRLRAVAGAWEQLRHAIDDGFAAHPVQVAVVAVELGRAGDARATPRRENTSLYSSSVNDTWWAIEASFTGIVTE